ncbi:MAG: DEAD/DEAH box helicase [Nannocystaceae bacterium]
MPTRLLALALSPDGRFYLDRRADAPGSGELDAKRLGAIDDAFAAGAGFGLLHLAGPALTSELPTSLAFGRELARRYLTALCRMDDLEVMRADLRIPWDEAGLPVLLLAAPPMRGGEYLTLAVLEAAWSAIEAAVVRDLALHAGSVADYLHERNPLWRVVGRVCFHLAEHRRDPARPFAFMATYARELGADGRVRHAPLKAALREYAGDPQALLRLLQPVHRAAEGSAVVRGLVDSRELFEPRAWTSREAHAFLQEVGLCEQAGVVVRVPDWWHSRPRPRIQITIGAGKGRGLGPDALLDFGLAVVIDGQELSVRELRELLARADQLQLVKGRWAEVDARKIEEVLARWRAVEEAVAREGLTYAQALRLLHGLPAQGDVDVDLDEDDARAWTQVTAGPWLERLLADLRQPDAAEADPGPGLKATLRGYQREGVAWLWLLARLGLGGCLADDMGLGKTVQVLAFLVLLARKRKAVPGPHLLVIPASLLGNWQAEQRRFAPELSLAVLHRSARGVDLEALEAELRAGSSTDVVLTTYGTAARTQWLREIDWGLVVLDEAQAIKNPSTRAAKSIKALSARLRIALTGTPVENHLGDLWSIFDFLCPGLLGDRATFGALSKRLSADGGPGFAPLRGLIAPYLLRRMKTDRRIIADLPDKIEVPAYCGLTRLQAALYGDAVESLRAELEEAEGIQRRGLILSYLTRFKQICNHPSQWLDDGVYRPQDSGKFARLRELCEPIAARQEKALIFTQFRALTGPLAEFLAGVFGRPGLTLHGQTRVGRRGELVDAFQAEGGPPFMVLSLKAGGTGLNLTAASHVIHFDRWWNPAVEAQATDRAFRIGQRRNVMVHKFVCRGTVEEKIDAMIGEKQSLSRELLARGAESALTEMESDALLRAVSLDIHSALAEAS